MSKQFEHLDESLKDWIAAQKIFFVASAPLSAYGHVNCSPKGGDTFRIIDPHTIAYQDLTGSGIETLAHLRENKRIVIMFCAFDSEPRILRLHGQGEAISSEHPDFEKLTQFFPQHNGTRSFIRVTLTRISDSCGFAAPIYEFKNHRNTLDEWAKTKGTKHLDDYRKKNNLESIDGLPGLS